MSGCGDAPDASQLPEASEQGENKNHKRIRVQNGDDPQHDTPDSNSNSCDGSYQAKKLRPDFNDGGDGDYTDDDDDYDDIDEDVEQADDFLDEADEDDVMMEDDRQSTASTSTTFSTGSSVGSNTPSLVGENLESFCLNASEETPKTFRISTGPLVKCPLRPLRRSLFSHVPPTLNFVHHNEVSETPLPADVRKHLRWKLSNITPAVVKRIVTNSGFRLMRKSCSEWGGSWGKHMKSPQFKDLNESQKLNHLPGTFNIGRKDRLWKNYQRLRLKFGREEFSFLPRTFLLPAETRLLRKVWERKGCRAKWIVKPPALARGNGIKVVNKWNQIPKVRPLIVQNYISKPHLINDTKYDLRIYVLLTSLCPLRVFLYDEGLVRFASNPYSADSKTLNDVFTHLTNYSINKNSSSYQANDDAESRQGHKWTLASLWTHFNENGIDSKPVIDSIKDLIIKTIISAEHNMYNVYRANLSSHYCGYELFGFDVLLDSKLKPWLIEVNISPSLHSGSPLDLDVKSPLATEVFNLARFHIPPAKISLKSQRDILTQLNMTSNSQLTMDRRLYARELSKSERAKHDKFLSLVRSSPVDRSNYLTSILENLTPDDVRFLIRSEDELAQATHFTRIFPTPDTHKYFKYFENPRYYNLLFDAWETKYGDDNLRAAAIDRLERLCVNKVHLKVPTLPAKTSEAVVKAKKAVPDVSMLKAPTGASAATFKPAEDQVVPDKVKTSSVTVTAKHHAVQKPLMPMRKSSPATRVPSSPEPMSTSGDTPVSTSDKSRSPSPPNMNNLVTDTTAVNDNHQSLIRNQNLIHP